MFLFFAGDFSKNRMDAEKTKDNADDLQQIWDELWKLGDLFMVKIPVVYFSRNRCFNEAVVENVLICNSYKEGTLWASKIAKKLPD